MNDHYDPRYEELKQQLAALASRWDRIAIASKLGKYDPHQDCADELMLLLKNEQ